MKSILLTVLLAIFSISAGALEKAEPELSPAELSIINQQIDLLKYPEERGIAKDWSNAKKIAEFLCKPHALLSLKKIDPTTDRVFLGTEKVNSLILLHNELLKGQGSMRTSKGWMDFLFICQLDAKTAKVINFQASLTDEKK